MKRRIHSRAVRAPFATSEMLLLPDGRLLVHNLTPDLAALLSRLNPDDTQIARRTEHPRRNHRNSHTS